MAVSPKLLCLFNNSNNKNLKVAIPLFFATKNKRFTIQMTLINGMFEPAAVLLCALVFGWDSKTANISESANSSMLAAGIISTDYYYYYFKRIGSQN